MKLLKLEIDAFRGAIRPFELPFDPGKSVTLLLGENGTGKSTIADALICLCTDDMGSLDDRSGVDKSFLVAAGRNPEDLHLALHTDAGSITARFEKKKIIRSPSDAPLTLRHLRRSSVVALSTAVPSARYEQLAGYFDLSGIVKSEDNLRLLCKNLKLENDRFVSVLSAVQKLLESVWTNEGSPLDDWELWAETESHKDINEERLQLRRVRNFIEQTEKTLGAHDRLVVTLKMGEQAAQTRKLADQQLADLQSTSGQDEALLTLLQQAHDFVARHADHESCPVCAQSIVPEQLKQALYDRMESMAGLRVAATEAETARREHERLQSVWQHALSDFGNALSDFLTTAQQTEWPENFKTALTEMNDPELPIRKRAELFATSRLQLDMLLEGRRITADAIQKTVDQHGFISENWLSVLHNRQTAMDNAVLLRNADKALKIVENTRKAFIDTELAAISADVDDFYQALHPKENLGGVRLFLKEKGKSSLELTARFHEYEDVAPQSLYSESHLDTLALCIFLALAKRYGGGETVLLLDDVLGATDDAHLDRFIGLLRRESVRFAHILLTSHQRALGERFRGQGDIQVVELGEWSVEKGMASVG